MAVGCPECGDQYWDREAGAACPQCPDEFLIEFNPNLGNEMSEAEIEMAKLDCPSCGGSGHKDDAMRPIETAPNDGTRILLWAKPAQGYPHDDLPAWHIGYWWKGVPGDQEGWVWHGAALVEFTHWLPLPAGPSSELN